MLGPQERTLATSRRGIEEHCRQAANGIVIQWRLPATLSRHDSGNIDRKIAGFVVWLSVHALNEGDVGQGASLFGA
jgi:hypothetical protein